LASRFGHVRAQSTFIEAAVIAAHGAASPVGVGQAARRDGDTGFLASDVRFFFLLFTNWVEHDVLRPEQDLDLTQVRRILTRLLERRWVARAPKAGRRERWLLTQEGLIGLTESVVEGPPRRPFDESLFVICFVALYGGPIQARVRADASPAVRKRLAALLDPRAAVERARRMSAAVRGDLEERIEGGRRLEQEVSRARADRASSAALVTRLVSAGSYQLDRVRPLSELMSSLPEDLVDTELDRGIARRIALLFEPLSARARAEESILAALADRLG
jgi:hypothetical protein